MNKKYPLGDYGLTIVLATLFLTSWIVQTFAGWQEFVAEQKQHGQAAKWIGDDGYVWTWLQATMENWQSEFLQLLTFVVLTTYLVHRKSHESRDNDDEVNEKLDKIEQKLEELASKK
jgi:hypothetical protein